MVTSIVTEREFPISEEDATRIDTDYHGHFHVVMEWADLSESPSETIDRLTREGLEEGERARQYEVQLRKRAEADQVMGEFRIRRPADDGARPVQHEGCGTIVATLPAGDWMLDRLIEEVRKHDCTIDGLIEQRVKANPGAYRGVVENARRLCQGTPSNADSEYARGLAEVLCHTLGITTDRKDDVSAWLCQD